MGLIIQDILCDMKDFKFILDLTASQWRGSMGEICFLFVVYVSLSVAVFWIKWKLLRQF